LRENILFRQSSLDVFEYACESVSLTSTDAELISRPYLALTERSAVEVLTVLPYLTRPLKFITLRLLSLTIYPTTNGFAQKILLILIMLFIL
jgi:hypothetical protein